MCAGRVNDRSGTRWEESPRPINSCRNLPFFLSLCVSVFAAFSSAEGQTVSESVAGDAEPS